MVAIITGAVLVALGLLTAGGGVWLALLGGSLFYILLAIGLLATGYLLINRDPRARWVYAALLAIDLGWALWEVGSDWWALAPRGALLTLIGIWLLLPWFNGRQTTTGAEPVSTGWLGARGALAAVIGLVGIVALVAVSHDLYSIDGDLSAVRQPIASSEPIPGDDWPAYGGDRYGRRFSSLTDVNAGNVANLKVAWVYHTGDKRLPTDPFERTFEVTPVKIGETMYLCTARNKVIALDATSGRPKWTFDPKIVIDSSSEHLTCRGVSYHEDPVGPTHAADEPCRTRLIVPTMDARLFALDAKTGARCPGFGNAGMVNLMGGMPNAKPGSYMVTSPPVIVRDFAIFGAAINDNVSFHNPSGVVRAYDVHTGVLAWNWDPGSKTPNATLKPGQSYSEGAPNMWSVASADENLGLVYLPLGNKSPDTWGGNRSPEVERFSSSIVALEAATGKLRWVVQTVHHDLWDRDVPSQPTLVDLRTPGGVVPALVGPTKQGDVFVLDRRTGKPIFPVTETHFDGRAVAGDRTSPTQPVSSFSFTPPPLQEANMWGATPFDQLACRIRFRRREYTGTYTPPSFKGSIIYPGNTGVFNWGGIAVDPYRQVMIGAPVHLAFVARLVPRENATKEYIKHIGKAKFGEDFGGPVAEPVGPLMSPIHLPCQAPPWGSLIGASLETGKTLWRHRNGTTQDQFPVLHLPLKVGVPSLGGPLVTAGGIFFYSGTLDNYLRAYDVTTGKLLWKGRLPAGGQATPMTYRDRNHRQVVVVAAGGHGSFGTTLGDAVVAYRLP